MVKIQLKTPNPARSWNSRVDKTAQNGGDTGAGIREFAIKKSQAKEITPGKSVPSDFLPYTGQI
jgi:hypothetical protein